MDYSVALGSGFLAAMAARPILVIGKHTWNAPQLAELGVIQTRACRILNGVAERLKVSTIKQLYDATSPYELAGKHGVGVTTLFVLLRVFDDAGLDTDGWYAHGQKSAVVTFHRLKQRELKAEKRTTRGRRGSARKSNGASS